MLRIASLGKAGVRHGAPAAGAAVRALGVVWMLAAAGCGSGRDVDWVPRRLGPESFPAAPAAGHGPVVKLGSEARPVLVAPERRLLVEEFGVPVEDGRGRVRVAPADVPAGPAGAALCLELQQVGTPRDADDAKARGIARTLAETRIWRRESAGWSLDRQAGELAVLEVEAPEPPARYRESDLAPRLNLRLQMLEPGPATLESVEFAVPADGELVLGYGLVETSPSDPRRVRFRATLRCGGGPERVVLDHTVRAAAARKTGWLEHAAPLPGDAARCALVLEARGADASAPRGAVFARPRIRAPLPEDEPATNLVLVSLDTLRADHLSGYGYGRETSPVIDRELIARGTTFEDVTASFPMTDVSHLSLFTGLYSRAQPARGRIQSGDRLVLLSERLRDAGYETVAFTEDAQLAGSYGFWLGFDRFTERPFSRRGRGATLEDGIAFLRATQGRRFFLFLHTYKTHVPFVANDPYSSLWTSGEDRAGDLRTNALVPDEHLSRVDAYDRTIREADALVGRFLEALDELGLAERTLVVVLSDHGESFGEHGLVGHGFAPHQEQLHVPLVLRGPGVPAGRRVSEPVSLVDVAPTLLDLLDLEPLPHVQGISLEGAIQGEDLPGERPLYFSWLGDQAAGVRIGELKLWTRGRSYTRVDVSSAGRRPSRVRQSVLGDRLLREHAVESERLRRQLAGGAPAQRLPVSGPVQDALRALGYLED